jgi:hypothetical protein
VQKKHGGGVGWALIDIVYAKAVDFTVVRLEWIARKTLKAFIGSAQDLHAATLTPC